MCFSKAHVLSEARSLGRLGETSDTPAIKSEALHAWSTGRPNSRAHSRLARTRGAKMRSRGRRYACVRCATSVHWGLPLISISFASQCWQRVFWLMGMEMRQWNRIFACQHLLTLICLIAQQVTCKSSSKPLRDRPLRHQQGILYPPARCISLATRGNGNGLPAPMHADWTQQWVPGPRLSLLEHRFAGTEWFAARMRRLNACCVRRGRTDDVACEWRAAVHTSMHLPSTSSAPHISSPYQWIDAGCMSGDVRAQPCQANTWTQCGGCCSDDNPRPELSHSKITGLWQAIECGAVVWTELVPVDGLVVLINTGWLEGDARARNAALHASAVTAPPARE